MSAVVHDEWVCPRCCTSLMTVHGPASVHYECLHRDCGWTGTADQRITFDAWHIARLWWSAWLLLWAWVDERTAGNASVRHVRGQRNSVLSVLARLVATLPKCDGDQNDQPCGRPATRAFKRGEARSCDAHGEGIPEYPRAPALREAIAKIQPDLKGGE